MYIVEVDANKRFNSSSKEIYTDHFRTPRSSNEQKNNKFNLDNFKNHTKSVRFSTTKKPETVDFRNEIKQKWEENRRDDWKPKNRDSRRKSYGKRNNRFTSMKTNVWAAMREEISDSEDEEEFDQQFEDMNWVYHFEEEDADNDADEETEFNEIIATVLEQYLDFQINNEEVYAAIPNNKSDLIFFDVFLRVVNNTIKALVDSGAGINLIRRDVIPANQKQLIQSCQGKGVVGFNGTRSVLDERITLRCTSGPMAWEDQFYVVEKSSMPRFALQNVRDGSTLYQFFDFRKVFYRNFCYFSANQVYRKSAYGLKFSTSNELD